MTPEPQPMSQFMLSYVPIGRGLVRPTLFLCLRGVGGMRKYVTLRQFSVQAAS